MVKLHKISCLVLFLFLFFNSNAQHENEEHSIDGWSYNLKRFAPEIELVASERPSIGINYGYELGSVFGTTSYKYQIIDFKTGLDYVFLSDFALNFKARITFTMAFPVLVGIQYNYSTDFGLFHKHCIEPLLGYNKYFLYTNHIKFFKVYLGYDINLNPTKNHYWDFPLRLHIILGF